MKGLIFKLNTETKIQTIFGWQRMEILEVQLTSSHKIKSDCCGKEVYLNEYTLIMLADESEIVEIDQDEFLEEVENDIYKYSGKA